MQETIVREVGAFCKRSFRSFSSVSKQTNKSAPGYLTLPHPPPQLGTSIDDVHFSAGRGTFAGFGTKLDLNNTAKSFPVTDKSNSLQEIAYHWKIIMKVFIKFT